MRIFQDLSEVTRDDNTIITLGTFDGIHAGHKLIIEEVVKINILNRLYYVESMCT